MNKLIRKAYGWLNRADRWAVNNPLQAAGIVFVAGFILGAIVL